ncbi:MAG: hypothetical protein J1F04_01760 [Oscillospiraceae bacterium]|nr:hypothetical protein [Oscillospiraceae bacterium]
MKKIIFVFLFVSVLLTGCSGEIENSKLLDNSNDSSDVNSTVENNESSESITDTVNLFPGMTREDFYTPNELYTFYQGDDCIVFKNNEFKDDIFLTSSYDPQNMTLAYLYQYKYDIGSSEAAYQILYSISEIIDLAERNNAYQHIYLDWALWGGKPIAYWTLTRGSDGKFYQDSDMVWYDTYIKEAFNKIMER